MTSWWHDLKRLLIWAGSILGLLFIVFVVNQFLTLYEFMSLIHPYFAIITITLLVSGLLWLMFRVFRQLFRNERVLELPIDSDEIAMTAYTEQLLLQLRHNQNLVEIDFDSLEKSSDDLIAESFAALQAQSIPLIKQNANAIFLTTAISQNGSLDSLVVLFSLFRMVWQLASLYQTRPTLMSMMKLYLQVATVVLMARTIEDGDLIESQMEPLIASILGESVASAIPGMVPVANLVVSSLMEGAVNSFLTLRVGFITQRYLSSQTPLEQQSVRRAASIQSIGYMGTIIKDNSRLVVKTVGQAAKKASVGTAKRWFGFESKVSTDK